MIDITKVENILKKPKLVDGYKKYISIMSKIKETNIVLDLQLQKEYKIFYGLKRYYSPEFCNQYFTILQELKNEEIDFISVFKRVKNIKGSCEISFTSKLVHTINPNFPIWDSIVTKGHFKISAPYYQIKNKEQICCERYEQYYSEFKNYMNTQEGKILINKFDEAFPDNNITNIKKIDFILWQDR